MTRMERRRKYQRRACIRLAVLIAALVAVTLSVAAIGGEAAEAEPEILPEAPVVKERPVAVTYEAEEDLDENELIEAALVEQGYFHEEIPLDYSLQDELITVCDEYNVPLHIALGVIQAESSFTEDAENGSCYGYMQINSVNKNWLNDSIGVTDLTDPYQNIRSGVYMLGDLHAKYGDWHKALIAYNYGEGGAQKYVFSKGLETTTYSRTVMAYAEEWEAVLG